MYNIAYVLRALWSYVLHTFGPVTVTCDGNFLKLQDLEFLSGPMKPLEKPSDLSVTEKSETTYN